MLAAVLAYLICSLTASAQELRVTSLSGEQMSDADLGKGTSIVIFWASWSPRSRNIAERVKPLASRFEARARVVTLNFEEDRRVVEAFVAGKSFGAPIFLDSDGAFSKKYAIATLPGLLVIKDGKVAYHGKLPDDPDRVITEILR